jgi:DNA-binding protein YbaB
MAGVGKFLKKSQEMQRSIGALQADSGARGIEVAAGGRVVGVGVSLSARSRAITLDPEFPNGDGEAVSGTALVPIEGAGMHFKSLSDNKMLEMAAAFSMPGVP